MVGILTKRQRWATLVVAAALGVAGATVLAVTRDPFTHFFNQGFGDLQGELATAREEGKKAVLVMFDDPECPWCHKMKVTILNQEQVQDYFRQHFRIARVDTRGDEVIITFDGKEMAEKDYAFNIHRVRATPVFIFFDLNGKQIFRYTGAARNVDEFMWLGEYIVGGHYKKEKFTVYKRQRRAAARNQ